MTTAPFMPYAAVAAASLMFAALQPGQDCFRVPQVDGDKALRPSLAEPARHRRFGPVCHAAIGPR